MKTGVAWSAYDSRYDTVTPLSGTGIVSDLCRVIVHFIEFSEPFVVAHLSIRIRIRILHEGKFFNRYEHLL